ncbi:MAG: hypothetical protein NVS3B5_19950 [Sphingomicrobium sp.]
MSEDRHAADDDLVYMVSGEDNNGDTTIFVSRNHARAEERHADMLSSHHAVKANWLDSWHRAAQ